jgi:thioredoxin-dependent peroxiredoxin
MAKNQAPRAVSDGPAKAANGGRLAVGGEAPAFRLPRDDGGTVGLADFAGRKLVLYFYPRAETSGCTREAVEFSRLKSAFSRTGTDILGVSADPVAALDRFKTKHKLTIALASDEDARCSKPMAYGSKRRCMAESSWAPCAPHS